jgi:hypothetical protein
MTMSEEAPHVGTEDGLRSLLADGYFLEVVCREAGEKRHNGWSGTWGVRAAAPDGTPTDRRFLFARPRSSGADQPLAQVAALAPTPPAVRASAEIPQVIETTALRYGSHDGLRQAGLSVADCVR